MEVLHNRVDKVERCMESNWMEQVNIIIFKIRRKSHNIFLIQCLAPICDMPFRLSLVVLTLFYSMIFMKTKPSSRAQLNSPHNPK